MVRKSKSTSQHSINVTVRVRPLTDLLSASTISVDALGQLSVDGKTVRYPSHVICGSEQESSFGVLGTPLLERLREGFNCTLLAYGQTGSGKTYTMFGPEGCLTESELEAAPLATGVPPRWGVFPRVALALLQQCEDTEAGDSLTLRASAVEVYQNKVYDLLNDRSPLKVGASSKQRVVVRGPGAQAGYHNIGKTFGHVHPTSCNCRLCFVAKAKAKERLTHAQSATPSSVSRKKGSNKVMNTVGETLWDLKSGSDVARLARLVETSRIAHGHKLNQRSSRSHCIVRLRVASQSGGKIRCGQFTFVDLAGSERTKKSGVVGQRQAEATAINASLSTLGRVIQQLGTGVAHVAFRDSTLTTLLRGAFTGRSLTAVCINVASEDAHANETVASLNFGERLAVLTTRTRKVKQLDCDGEAAKISAQLATIRARLAVLKDQGKGGEFGPSSSSVAKLLYVSNTSKLEELTKQSRDMKQRMMELKTQGKVDEQAKLQKAMRTTEEQRVNLRDIVMRQETIKGFWIPPSPGYRQLQASAQALEDRLHELGVS